MTVVKTLNRYWLRPMTDLGTQIRVPVSGVYRITREHWQQSLTSTASVHYAEHLGGVILQPREELAAMTLSGFDLTGQWRTVPMPATNNVDWLYAYHAGANQLTSAETLYAMPPNPCIALRVARMGKPSAQLAAIRWRMVAMGCNLDFGGLANPVIALPDGSERSYPLSLSEQEKYFFDEQLIWRFHAIEDNLVVTCSAFSEPWILYNVGDIEAAPVAITGYGGAYAYHVMPIRFAGSGSFDQWVDHPTLPPAAEVNTWVLGSVPEQASAVTAVHGADSGHRRKYRTTLTGDTYHTPILYGWQYYYRPVYEPDRTEQREEISDWIRSARESLPNDLAERTLELEVINTPHEMTGLTFREYLENWDPNSALGIAAGQCGLEYETGYELADGGQTIAARGVVLLPMRELVTAIREADVYRISCRDRAHQLTGELWWSLCLTGWPVEEAIAYYAEISGIDPRDIVIHPAAAAGSVEPSPGDWWGARYGAPASELYLWDPQRNYDNPPWLAQNGSNALDRIRQICERFGFRAEFWADNCYHIYQRNHGDEATMATYSMVSGEDDLLALAAARWRHNLGESYTTLMVEGRDPYGEPLHASRENVAEIYGPGGDRYLGYRYTRSVVDDNLTSQDAVNYTAAVTWRDRPGGRELELRAPFAGWDRWPEQRVEVIAPRVNVQGGVQYRIVEASVTLGQRTNETILRVEEVP